MIRNILEFFDSKEIVSYFFKKQFPNEIIRFISAATYFTTKEKIFTGWTFARLLQRRVVMIVSNNRIIVRSVFFSLWTIFYILLGAYSLNNWFFISHRFELLIIFFICVYHLYLRRPFFRDIQISEIVHLKVAEIQGFFGKFSAITIILSGGSIQLVPFQLFNLVL
ncbi:MAG: hypothetical protein ACE5JB_08850 [bacterium]